MSSNDDSKRDDQRAAFEEEASAKQIGLVAEFFHFLLNTKVVADADHRVLLLSRC